MGGERPSQQPVATELLANERGVAAKIEHAVHTFDNPTQQSAVGNVHVEDDRMPRWLVRDADCAGRAVNGDGPSITGVVDRLHARRCTRREKREQRIPVVRWTVGEPETIPRGLDSSAGHRSQSARHSETSRPLLGQSREIERGGINGQLRDLRTFRYAERKRARK